jgi:4-amino-4-deoxy-L-arabinose transferase-like glycosyltransferase
VAGGISLIVFAATASHLVANHDTAEFQTLAGTGGIAHAGYPALVMLLEAVGRLPFGTLAYRANLVSAVSGAVAVGTAAWLGARLSGRVSAGIVAALALALSITCWRESTHAGVHVFTLAIGAAAFLSAARFAPQPNGSAAFAIGALLGLGLVSHLTILALGPVVAIACLLAARTRRMRARHVLVAAFGVLVGLMPLAYLISHDRPDQPMNYIHDTLRPDNAGELSGGHPPMGRIARTAWLLSARQYLGGFVFSPFSDPVRRLRDLGLDLVMNEFTLWGVPFVLVGAWMLWRRRDGIGLLLAAWFAGTIFWLLYGAQSEMTPIFFLPGLWVLAVVIAVGLAELGRRSRPALVAACALLILTPLVRVSIAAPPAPIGRSGVLRGLWEMAPARWNPFAPDRSWEIYGRGVMASLPPRAVVLSCWDEAPKLRFFRYAEPLRTDVDILYHCHLPLPAFAAADSAGRPIFTTYALTPEMTGGRGFREVARWSRGGLWRIDPPSAHP